MLQLYIFEPQPQLSALLKSSQAVRIVACENTPALGSERVVTCDLVLVSAAFSPDAVLDLVRAGQRREQPVVIAEIGENDPALITFLEAGAAGYLVEGASRTEAIQTLYSIHEGKPPLAAPIGTALLKRLYELLALEQQGTTAWAPREGAELEGLTPREREVLELIHRGASNQEIAQALTIELGTVKNHVHNILKKLKVSRREQAALLIERGEPADLNP